MPRRSVLVVDDVPTIRLLEKRILEKEGYECLIASDGPKALQVLASRSIDVAMVDIVMPGMSGVELFKVIRRQYPDVAVVFVTALDDVDTAIDQIKDGAYDFLVKPVKPERLRQAVQAVFEKREAELMVHNGPMQTSPPLHEARVLPRASRRMTWTEAMRRTSTYLLWFMAFAAVFELVLFAGAMSISWGLGDLGNRKEVFIVGVGLSILALGLIALTGLVVWIKTSTDVVADHVEERLRPTLSSPGNSEPQIAQSRAHGRSRVDEESDGDEVKYS